VLGRVGGTIVLRREEGKKGTGEGEGGRKEWENPLSLLFSGKAS
jgi:hypothetical protein